MDDNHPVNEYGAYVISSKTQMTFDEMTTCLHQCLALSPEQYNDRVLHLRKCNHRDVEDTKRWHLCMAKALIATARENAEAHGLTFYIYRPNKKPLGRGKTYAYYIPYQSVLMKEQIVALFARLDGRFIRTGSYNLHHPSPRSDGSERKYIIVSFQKTNDVYPRSFIRVLRALLDDSQIGQGSVEVKWCSHSVLKDVITGAEK